MYYVLLGLHGIVERRVVYPEIACRVILLGSRHEQAVLGFETADGVFAVGPAVLEVAIFPLTQ